MIEIGKGGQRPVLSVYMSRYATQTEEKLRRDNIKGKQKANRTHREVGKKVRQTIKELGGTMPENLPVAEDIKKLETKQRKKLKDKSD